MKYYKQDIQSQPSYFVTEYDEMHTEPNKRIISLIKVQKSMKTEIIIAK